MAVHEINDSMFTAQNSVYAGVDGKAHWRKANRLAWKPHSTCF